MGRLSQGRLVWNHSTHIPGLIPILNKLTKVSVIQTITPGEIKTVRAACAQTKTQGVGPDSRWI